MYKVFSYQKRSETPKCSAAKFFGTMGQKEFYESRDNSLRIKFFDNANFPKHQKDTLTNFFVITPSVVYRNFRVRLIDSSRNKHQKLSEKPKGPPYKCFRYCDAVRQKSCRELFFDTPPF